MTGRVHLARQVAEQVEELWEDSSLGAAGFGASLTVLAMVAEAFALAGELDRTARYQLRAAPLLQSADLAAKQQGAAVLAQAGIWAEHFGGPYVPWRGRGHGTAHGAPAILSLALGLSGELGWWTGRWDSAYADATEALQWAEEIDRGRPDRARPVAAVPDYGRTRQP